jgi:putative ABC transport system substrate-binding protein
LLVADTPLGRRGVAMLTEVSDKLGISFVGPLLESPFDETTCRRAFAAMVQEGAEAVYVGDQAEPVAIFRLIVELAHQHGLPAIYPYRRFVEVGGLMAYEYDVADQYIHAANTVDQIFKGKKPGDIPFYQAVKFDFLINLKTAKALSVEISPNLLAQADEVIE